MADGPPTSSAQDILPLAKDLNFVSRHSPGLASCHVAWAWLWLSSISCWNLASIANFCTTRKAHRPCRLPVLRGGGITTRLTAPHLLVFKGCRQEEARGELQKWEIKLRGGKAPTGRDKVTLCALLVQLRLPGPATTAWWIPVSTRAALPTTACWRATSLLETTPSSQGQEPTAPKR